MNFCPRCEDPIIEKSKSCLSCGYVLDQAGLSASMRPSAQTRQTFETPPKPIWCTRDTSDLPADLSNVTLDDLEPVVLDPLADSQWRRNRDIASYSSSKYVHENMNDQ